MAFQIHLHSNGSAEVLDAGLAQTWLDNLAEEWFAASADHHAEVWVDGLRPLDEVADSEKELRDLIDRSRVASFERSLPYVKLEHGWMAVNGRNYLPKVQVYGGWSSFEFKDSDDEPADSVVHAIAQEIRNGKTTCDCFEFRDCVYRW